MGMKIDVLLWGKTQNYKLLKNECSRKYSDAKAKVVPVPN
jgi:hypothetical protein